MKLLKCRNICWCEFCGKAIIKNQSYLQIYKNAWRGFTRTNICIMCLNKLHKTINKKELKEVKNLRVIENI